MVQIPEPIARMMAARAKNPNPAQATALQPQPVPVPARKCGNCGTPITCGCQKRVASNGREVCDECLGGYESSLSGHLVEPK